jgi:hypothetical protein
VVLPHPRLQLPRGAIEEVRVGIARVDVQLVHELGTDRLPVALQVVEEVVVLTPVLRDTPVDGAGPFVEERLDVAVFA